MFSMTFLLKANMARRFGIPVNSSLSAIILYFSLCMSCLRAKMITTNIRIVVEMMTIH